MKILNVAIREIRDVETISTRNAAIVLGAYIKKQISNDISIEGVKIDFKGVSFISRSFADEICKVRKNLEKENKKVEFINVEDCVGKMIDVIYKTTSNNLNIINSAKNEVIQSTLLHPLSTPS